MSESSIAATQVKVTIRSAFDMTPRPRNDNICSSSKERIAVDTELQAIIKNFANKSWFEINSKIIFIHQDALPLFTSLAFQYFLPAYLTASIGCHHPTDSLPINTVLSLSPKNSEGEPNLFSLQRFELFDQKQAKAIQAFLQFIQEFSLNNFARSHAGEALEYYWNSRVSQEV